MDILLFNTPKQCEKRKNQDSDSKSGFSSEFALEKRKANQIPSCHFFISFHSFEVLLMLPCWYTPHLLLKNNSMNDFKPLSLAFPRTVFGIWSLKWSKFNKHFMSKVRDSSWAARVDYYSVFFFVIYLCLFLGTPAEELSNEEKELGDKGHEKERQTAVRPYYAF